MKNISQYVLYGLMAVGAIVVLMSVFSTDMDPNHEPMLIYTYALSIGAGVLALVALVLGMIANTSTMKTMGLIVAGLVVVYGISTALSNGDLTEKFIELEVTESVSKLSGTGLIAVYVLMALSVGSMLFSAVLKIVRK